jgi:GNAT superfamily N-acetyltransferase
VIRHFRPEDAEGVADLLRNALETPWVATSEDVLHWEHHPPRARRASWVATEGSEIVGWAVAQMRWEVSEQGVAEVWGAVARNRRGRGIGASLFDVAERHLSSIEATKVQSWAEADEGKRFLTARGFREVRRERISSLDPRELEPKDLPVPKGFRVVPLRDVLDRPRELYAVYMAGEADAPDVFEVDNISFEEWELETLGTPSLDQDGSFVVVHGERPVSIALLEVDREHKRATNEMTATLPEFRRRGLARLAKSASLHWAGDLGVTSILTSNDRENPGMLALNDQLGYQPLVIRGLFVRSPAGPD